MSLLHSYKENPALGVGLRNIKLSEKKKSSF